MLRHALLFVTLRPQPALPRVRRRSSLGVLSGQAKVRYSQVAVARDQQVARLQVAVNDAVVVQV